MRAMKSAFCVSLVLLLASCRSNNPGDSEISADLLAEINQIRAIDDHAHPVRYTGSGEPADREFDALPVDNLESGSDPLQLRSTDPGLPLIGIHFPGKQGIGIMIG